MEHSYAAHATRGKFSLSFLSAQSDEGHQHLLQADTAMLEGILVILHVIVIVVGVGKEVVLHGKDVGRAEVRTGQACPQRFLYLEYLLLVVRQILAQLVAQVRIRVPVANHLHRVVAADAAVVGPSTGVAYLNKGLGEEEMMQLAKALFAFFAPKLRRGISLFINYSPLVNKVLYLEICL